ncbi:chemotaxis protein CheD [Paludibacterium yongneupense]|uniref:chemotaxis protein CheD n=1 Tax=Paludibacterium yongneupense TaxID=400061 RepID=UPI0004234337|nr:chemotaxis protein CheD [Paludibacterium yongneupense]
MTLLVREDVFLRPGEWHFGDAPERIRTLLGSCVSITLWHPRLKVGGMCHYLLATRSETDGALSGRYADEAMLLLLRAMLATGRPIKEFHAKLIGGAAVLPTIERNLPVHDVPGRNIDAARTLARQLGLNVQAEDVGGTSARLVMFDIDSGDVWVRQTQVSDISTEPEIRREKR